MGLFSGFNADVNDLPEVGGGGPPEGVYDATLTAVEVREDIYKQDDGSQHICFDFTIPGYDFPKTISQQLPDSPAPWDDTHTFATINGKDYTEKSTMEYRLARVSNILENLGIPKGPEQDSVNPTDLIDLPVVLTLRKNKKDYVNAVKAVVKKNADAVLPQTEAVPDIVPQAASTAKLWG